MQPQIFKFLSAKCCELSPDTWEIVVAYYTLITYRFVAYVFGKFPGGLVSVREDRYTNSHAKGTFESTFSRLITTYRTHNSTCQVKYITGARINCHSRTIQGCSHPMEYLLGERGIYQLFESRQKNGTVFL